MSERIVGRSLPLPGLFLLERIPVQDARGSLERLFCSEILASLGVRRPLAQINLTRTRRRGSVRGMHFQHPPHAETKIVSCLRGRVFDVAVDVRRGSPTFLRWHAEELSPEGHASLLIPEGFAHGFQALADECELLYFHTAAWHAEAEGGLRPTDPALGISWPLPIADMSERDAGHPAIDGNFAGVDA
jgi:dTDP-4-dehydrorhamnose 3,5-epimerase